MPCTRHPRAVPRAGVCPACLFEAALASAGSPLGPREDAPDVVNAAEQWHLTVAMPLGASATSTVFLVRDDESGRLLRMKTWSTQAPDDFVARIDALRTRLRQWGNSRVPAPIAASVDRAGRAVVLSEFWQGLPLQEGLATGTIAPARALPMLGTVEAVLDAAHARGLAHGSVGAGNVLVPPDGGSLILLDFGLAVALAAAAADWAAADMAGVAALDRALTARLGDGPRGRL